MSGRTFSHCGDLGDIIYALPAVRGLGGGSLWLRGSHYTRVRMTPERAPDIAGLLEMQPYIERCFWKDDENADVPLDGLTGGTGFRKYVGSGMNITQMHLKAMELSEKEADTPWIEVEPQYVSKVVINVTDRYRNENFPWSHILKAYRSDLVMVGYREEHEAFVQEFGDVPFVSTATLLDLARVIAGCLLFVGNQSAPLALAEAMKRNVIHETALEYPMNNCVTSRPGRITFTEGELTLPKLEELER